MKKYSQCLMCVYVFGRTCKRSNSVIDESIYNNEVKCELFKSLCDEELYEDDPCCSENSRVIKNS